MKSQYIKKKTVERLRDGFHTDLMAIFEESIDIYTEKTFKRGYQSFFGDAMVHAHRIAVKLGYKGDDVDMVTGIINEYFNSLKNE